MTPRLTTEAWPGRARVGAAHVSRFLRGEPRAYFGPALLRLDDALGLAAPVVAVFRLAVSVAFRDIEDLALFAFVLGVLITAVGDVVLASGSGSVGWAVLPVDGSHVTCGES
jgi:hypothetical protein